MPISFSYRLSTSDFVLDEAFCVLRQAKRINIERFWRGRRGSGRRTSHPTYGMGGFLIIPSNIERFWGGRPNDQANRWTVLSTSYFQRDGGPRTPAIDLA
jgi:hypothetical protein